VAFRAAAYQRYEGPRRRTPGWWPLWRATFRRGWSSPWVKRITLGSLGMALAITLVLYFIQRVAPEWRSLLEEMGERVAGEGGGGVRFDARIYLTLLHWFLYPALLPLAVLLGYDLMAGDLRGNALESYFSRPVTPLGYVVGRTLAFTSYLLLATLVPLLWIWVADVATAPAEHFGRVRSVPLGLTATMGLTALTMALFVQALTTLTRNGTWTALVVVILFVLSGAVGPVLYEVTGDSRMLALAFWENLFVVGNTFLGSPVNDAGMAPFSLCLGLQIGLAVFSLVYLLRQVRRKALLG